MIVKNDFLYKGYTSKILKAKFKGIKYENQQISSKVSKLTEVTATKQGKCINFNKYCLLYPSYLFPSIKQRAAASRTRNFMIRGGTVK